MLLLLLSVVSVVGGGAADVVFRNGNIYTNDERQPRAEAVVVRGGRLVYVGSNQGAQAWQGKSVVDLQGRTVVPGLVDAHAHLAGIGAREATLNLEGVESLEGLLRIVAAEAARKKAGAWVV